MRPRVFTGIGPAPQRNNGWNAEELHAHVRGRGEATAAILIGVAALRSANVLPANTVISVQGAKWQDWTGTEELPRAHRFPCNPQINGRDLPDWASTAALRNLFERSLAVTDALFFHVNYADRLFETHGGIEAARKAIETVLSVQKAGAPVTRSAVVMAWRHVAWAGYMEAWSNVERVVLDSINRESAATMMRRNATFRQLAPKDNVETVIDVVYDAKQSTELVSLPGLLTVPGFESVLRELHG